LAKIVNDRWYAAFLTVLGSGLRLGELVALKWENIDLEKGIIHVKQSAVRVKDEESKERETKLIFQAPKTKKSLRAEIAELRRPAKPGKIEAANNREI
jgi:integrase